MKTPTEILSQPHYANKIEIQFGMTVTDIKEAMDEYEGQSKWVSVGERLPQHKDRVLCATKIGVLWNSFEFCTGRDGNDKLFLNYDFPFGNASITHWQHLPLPPTP